MSKSHKSRGRGGLRRHIQMHPARRSSGRRHYKTKGPPAGATGWKDGDLIPAQVATIAETRLPASDAPIVKKSGFISLNDLKEAVIQPGIEKHLEPLLLYRGSLQMGKVKRLWNYVQLMKLAGSQSASEAVKLFHNPDVPHLLGPSTKYLPLLSIETFLSRMHDHLDIAAAIPGLPEYIREQIAFRKFNLTKISAADRRSRLSFRREAGDREWENGAPQRTLENRKRAHIRDAERPKDLFYPFMIHDPQDDASELVKFINTVVPRGLSPDLRADVCQEMLLAVLSGEISREDAHDKRYEMMKRVMRMNGISDRALSLDAPMPGHSKTILELVTETEWVDPWADQDEELEDA